MNLEHSADRMTFEWKAAHLVEAGQTPGRRRCSRCSSIVCGARTLSRSGSLERHRLAPAASEVEVDTGRSSAAAWTVAGWGTRSPERQNNTSVGPLHL